MDMETEIWQVYCNGLLEMETPIYREAKELYDLLESMGYDSGISSRYKDEYEY
jgi:hypothetical protein